MAGDNDSESAGEGIGTPSLILGLLNTVAFLASVGFLYYVKLVFKRPEITDTGERNRLAAAWTKPSAPPSPAYIQFPSQTINIESMPHKPRPSDGSVQQIEGKLHFVTVGLSLEIREASQQEAVENLRPYILDQLLTILGHKSFQELNSVQGRYLVESQIIDSVNQVLVTHMSPPPKDDLVTNVYFTEFLVQ